MFIFTTKQVKYRSERFIRKKNIIERLHIRSEVIDFFQQVRNHFIIKVCRKKMKRCFPIVRVKKNIVSVGTKRKQSETCPSLTRRQPLSSRTGSSTSGVEVVDL